MAQLRDLIVNGASRLIGDAYTNKIQINSISAYTNSDKTAYGLGTNGQILTSDGINTYWGNNSLTAGSGSMTLYPESSNELNFGGITNSNTIYIGYRAKDNKPVPAKFVFGEGTGTANLQVKRVYLSSGTTSYIDGSSYTGKAATAGVADSANAVAWDNVSGIPATSISWTAGTTAGPTLTVTAAGSTSSAVAIPTATESASGVVTTDAQTFKGRKGFGIIDRYGKNNTGAANRYIDTYLYNAAGTQVGEVWYDIGNTTNITKGQYYFRQYSPNTTANTSTTGYHETYSLPNVTSGLTANKSYNILTSKSTVSIDQGGTGNTSFTANRLVGKISNTQLGSIGSIYVADGKLAVNKTSITSGYNFEVSGSAILSGKIHLSGTDSNTALIEFSRAGTAPYNYITIPTSSTLAIAVGSAGGANTRFAINGSAVLPTLSTDYTRVTSLGTSDIRWQGVYSTKFNGASGTTYGDTLPSTGEEGQIFFQLSNPQYELPTGGTTGQVLVKNSNSDRDVVWSSTLNDYVKKSGDTMTGELICSSPNGIRFTYGGTASTDETTAESVLLRNDGSNFWFLCCSSDTPGDNWFGNHPLRIELSTHYTHAYRLYGAVWNDYAEYRKNNEKEKDIQKPGYCVKENGDGALSLTTKRLERGCEIISDTFGFAIGQDEENGYNTPIASSGRVLAYPYESIEEFASHIGYAVCSGPNGTVSIMTDEEEEKYPSRIIGTISEIPNYEEWGSGKVKVNGRIWIRIR